MKLLAVMHLSLQAPETIEDGKHKLFCKIIPGDTEKSNTSIRTVDHISRSYKNKCNNQIPTYI